MGFSHRELRAHRELRRLTGSLIAAVLALGAAAVLLPLPWVGVLAVLGLAGAGAWTSLRGRAIARRYSEDLHSVHRDASSAPGSLRAEVVSSRGLGELPSSATRPSPHRHPRATRPVDPEIRPRPRSGGSVG